MPQVETAPVTACPWTSRECVSKTGKETAWGSCKWGDKSPNKGYVYSYLTYNPLITTHEPPSKQGLRRVWGLGVH